jgi:hypothetical protein
VATSAPRDVTVAPGSPRTSPAEREVVTAVIAYGLDRIGAARSVGQFASFCATGRRRPPRGCTTLNRALAAGWEVIVTFDDGLAVASPLWISRLTRQMSASVLVRAGGPRAR